MIVTSASAPLAAPLLMCDWHWECEGAQDFCNPESTQESVEYSWQESVMHSWQVQISASSTVKIQNFYNISDCLGV